MPEKHQINLYYIKHMPNIYLFYLLLSILNYKHLECVTGLPDGLFSITGKLNPPHQILKNPKSSS